MRLNYLAKLSLSEDWRTKVPTIERPRTLEIAGALLLSSSPPVPRSVPRDELLIEFGNAFLRHQPDSTNSADDEERLRSLDMIRDAGISVISIKDLKDSWFQQRGIPGWIYEPMKAYVKPFMRDWAGIAKEEGDDDDDVFTSWAI